MAKDIILPADKGLRDAMQWKGTLYLHSSFASVHWNASHHVPCYIKTIEAQFYAYLFVVVVPIHHISGLVVTPVLEKKMSLRF